MNERIRELAADARGQMVVLTTVDDEQWRRHEEFVEKFAELIVKECARKIEDMIDNGWYADTEQLKKHFGVKE
jgi:undecaprenyl pyrophosphate synthase